MTDDRPFDWPDHWLPVLEPLRRRVASLCLRWSKDAATTDDVFQQTVLKVILLARDETTSRDRDTLLPRKFAHADQLLGYASRVAFSVLNDARRKKGPRPAGDDLPEVGVEDADATFVAEHLELIPDRRAREVVRLHVVEGWTLAEVAAHLGLSVTRVHQLREQGLAAIRGRLDP